MERVSANATESATKMRSEISSHLIHRPLRPLHGPMDRRGFMSHHGSSVSITRYTFRMISRPLEESCSELEYLFRGRKPIYYLPHLRRSQHKSNRPLQGPSFSL